LKRHRNEPSARLIAKRHRRRVRLKGTKAGITFTIDNEAKRLTFNNFRLRSDATISKGKDTGK